MWHRSIIRPVYIESRVCVVKDAIKCSFEYLSVVYHTPSLNKPSYNQTQTFQNRFLVLGFSSIFLNQGQRPWSVWHRSIIRPVYIESRVCVVKDAIKCSFEYLSVVYHTPSLTNYIALNKRLKQTRTNFLHTHQIKHQSLHNKKIICRPVYFRVRHCRVTKAEYRAEKCIWPR